MCNKRFFQTARHLDHLQKGKSVRIKNLPAIASKYPISHQGISNLHIKTRPTDSTKQILSPKSENNSYFCRKFDIMTKAETTNEKSTQVSDSNDKKNNLTLKDWAMEDRPREKLIAKGKKELSNAELIAILIGSGSVGQSAVDLAKEILNSNDNNLSLLSRQGIKELTRDFKGMGEAKAVTIIAALELGYRMLTENIGRREYYIKDSLTLFNYISPSLIDLPVEEFWAIYLNARNKVLFKQRISIGGITDTPVDVRRIFATALEKNAVSIAVAHNHPTGHLSPSKEDKNLTCRILDAGKILNIQLRDHIIVGIGDNNQPDYFSFYDNGLI